MHVDSSKIQAFLEDLLSKTWRLALALGLFMAVSPMPIWRTVVASFCAWYLFEHLTRAKA